MTVKNPVKNGIVTRDAPCGFSKYRHKKMVKKKIAKDISLEDINNIGYGIGRIFKALVDGLNRGVEDDLNESVLGVSDRLDIKGVEFDSYEKERYENKYTL